MLIFIAFNLCVKAQTIGYTYKALAAEGCSIKYSVTKQDSVYYIIVTVRSDRLNFLKESTFWLKTFDGDIIKLRGEVKLLQSSFFYYNTKIRTYVCIIKTRI